MVGEGKNPIFKQTGVRTYSNIHIQYSAEAKRDLISNTENETTLLLRKFH
jgi:hypothetical protein